uniref:DM14 domain-containing protein n=1 Tax=Astyanax mexicanus TaxID=7994 RepID=A0A8B9JEX6_ASTMX
MSALFRSVQCSIRPHENTGSSVFRALTCCCFSVDGNLQDAPHVDMASDLGFMDDLSDWFVVRGLYTAELNEVLEDDDEPVAKPVPAPTPAQRSNLPSKSTPTTPSGAGGLESQLQERIEMYQTAITNANAAGETSKARRYDRGLKTLQTMLTSVKKGKPINEEEIPPPVATGGKPTPAQQSEPVREREEPAPAYTPPQRTNEKPLQEAKPVAPPKPQLLQPPNQKPVAKTPDTPAISPLTPSQPNAQHSELKASVLSRQREYKLAAIQAKQSGDTELAKQHYLIAKKLDSVVEAVDRGEPIDTSSLPPPPVQKSAPPPSQSSSIKPATAPAPSSAPASDALPAPRNLAEALQQRMDKYKSAAETAKSKGDDRKARMHQRIVKQYQDAIRAHKAGRPVNLAELPVPPGCPPLQGSESGQNFMGVLETAVKLANQDADEEDDDGSEEEGAKPAVRPAVQKARAPAPPQASAPAPKLGPKSQQQLEFLMSRRQQFVKAALRSKQMKDVQGAAQHLRNAKGLDNMISATKSGLPVDISKVPAAPISDEDYTLSRSRASPLSPRSAQQYTQLMDLLKQQHEKCLTYSQQFTHMGNVAETARWVLFYLFLLHVSNLVHVIWEVCPLTTFFFVFVCVFSGLFKQDKVVGNAQLKLEALENQCEIREIIEVTDEHTHSVTHPITAAHTLISHLHRDTPPHICICCICENITYTILIHAPSPKSKPRNDHSKNSQPSLSPPQYKLYSFSLLNYDRERMERRIGEYKKNRRDPPADLINQHKDVCHRLHWQKSYLERGSSAALTEYDNVLGKITHGLAESVKKLSSEGNRVSNNTH